MKNRIINNIYLFWALLALPALTMTVKAMNAADVIELEELLHPTGEFAARFIIIAMMVTPLRMLFPDAGWLRWLAARRRALGVAAFGYALLHTVFYLLAMETLANILAEFWALGIWTGWFAFFIFIPLAITSNDNSVRLMKRAWSKLHRLVYIAALLTLVHWIFVHNNLGPALLHFIPLAGLEIYRIIVNRKKSQAAVAS